MTQGNLPDSSPDGKGPNRKRQAAQRRGRFGESLALLYLRLRGYRLLARGYRTRQGEIDLVLRQGRLLIFVEVKQRGDLDRAAEAIRPRQQRRITAAASQYLQDYPGLARLDQRFDAILLAPWRLPRHVKDAWRESDHGYM